MQTISIGFDGMTLEDLTAIARDAAQAKLTDGAGKRIRETRGLVERWVDDEQTIYGITTGFGALSDVDVTLEISHNWVADLTAVLVSPSGTLTP